MVNVIANFELNSKEKAEANFELQPKKSIGAEFTLRGAGGGGTFDHSLLINRELPDQHPIEAITGLSEALESASEGLSNEITRATQAEANLQSQITSVDNSLQQTIGDLNNEIFIARRNEADLQSNIEAETTRAERAEADLLNSLEEAEQTLNSAIEAENTRALAAENTLNNKIDDEIVARTEDTAQLGDAINDEQIRAEQAENTLQQNIDTLSQTTSASITAEYERALAAEQQLTQSIQSESASRQSADNELSSRISAEEIARTQADSDLASEISSEANAREQADEQLQEQITANSENFNNYRTSVDQDAIDTAIGERIDGIDELIPTQASSSNQLADRDFVNSSINSITAFYITKDAQGSPFSTHAELVGATIYYSGGEVRVPTKNDYCVVLADETHPTAAGLNPTTRYLYNNQWEYQYTINDTALTSDQLKAINSGITSELVAQISTNQANIATNTQDISNEVERATGIEQSLQEQINSKQPSGNYVTVNTEQTITAKKTFSGGTGGNNPGVTFTNGAIAGTYTTTGWTGFATHRLCDNKINTGSFYINSDGSVIYRHKTGTATAEGGSNDALLMLHPVNGITAGYAGTAGGTAVAHAVLIDTITYSNLTTTTKDVLGAINELNSGKQENLDITLLEGAIING